MCSGLSNGTGKAWVGRKNPLTYLTDLLTAGANHGAQPLEGNALERFLPWLMSDTNKKTWDMEESLGQAGWRSYATDPGPLLVGTRRDLGALTLHRVACRKDSGLWNELIERYHYLGYTPLPGAQIRYLIRNESRLLGAIGMGASAWKVAPRDLFIGWTPTQREQRLHLVINQARFLILPWVQVKNLASSVLSLLSTQVASDWKMLYAYRPVLMETFVEQKRFQGTCYRAANWIYVGQTQGRGKLDIHNLKDKPVKNIFLFPLEKNFRYVLTKPT